MTPEELGSKVLEWSALRFFPADREGRNAITKAVVAMAGSAERAVWIVDQVLAITNDWPGIAEVRGIFCLRFKPADGISWFSELCQSGQIPADKAISFTPQPALEAPRDPRDRSLPAGIAGDAVRAVLGAGKRL